MANKNTTDLIADLVRDVVENNQGLISADLLRGRIIDIVQSRGLFEVYVGTKVYEQNESIVFTDNNIYRCLIQTEVGENPTSTPSKWKKTASLVDELNPVLGGDLDSDNNRILESQGDDIASANNITLESTLNGNTYVITGTTQINLIETLDWQDGAEITLQFIGILTIANGVVASGNFAPIHLAKGSDYTTSPNDTFSFKLINDEWFEISNTIPLAGSGVANGGISDQAQTIVGPKTFDDLLNIINEFRVTHPGVAAQFINIITSSTGHNIDAEGEKVVNISNEGNLGISVDINAKVGIKNTSPSFDFDVNGTGRYTGTLQLDTETASTIASFDANKKIKSLPTATYPSLPQLALMKKSTTTYVSSATPTPVGSQYENELYITALAVNAIIAAPTGAPVNGNTLLIRIFGASSHTLGLNDIYNDLTGNIPSDTVAGKEMYLGCIYNSRNSKWDIVGYSVEP